MIEQWINLADIPATGREFSFQDSQTWVKLWNEFSMECREDTPLTLSLEILPLPGGYLLRGTLQGSVIMPCNRCLQDARVEIEQPFDIFEVFIRDAEDPETETFIRKDGETWELDIAALMWEQFILALPDRQICSPECKGICPGCGKNLNLEQCECKDTASDTGLALLQGLKIPSKK